MKRQLEKSIKQWIGIFAAIISYYIVHEGMHLLLALLFGVFENIRFVGILGIQIVIKENSLSGLPLALFSGVSVITTILIGYLLAFRINLYSIKNKNILICLYYITACFLVLDPLYMSILSNFVGGGDLNGIITGLNTTDVFFRILFGIILILNVTIFIKKVAPKYSEIFSEKR